MTSLAFAIVVVAEHLPEHRADRYGDRLLLLFETIARTLRMKVDSAALRRGADEH